MTITIGSLFSGLGGFELGLERGIPNSKTIWQVEQDKYCQSILKKHWPAAELFDDVKSVGAHNLKPVDVICGGFPCQDISQAGKGKGINEGKKSSLYWELFRVIRELRPRIIILENVAAIINRGLSEVLGSLATIGYDAEWLCITAQQFGAPHIRKRFFLVAYPSCERRDHGTNRLQEIRSEEGDQSTILYGDRKKCSENFKRSSEAWFIADAERQRLKEHTDSSLAMETKIELINRSSEARKRDIRNYWERYAPEPALCSLDDGISQRVARLRALGNAIVPQCSQWIGEQIYNSFLFE